MHSFLAWQRFHSRQARWQRGERTVLDKLPHGPTIDIGTRETPSQFERYDVGRLQLWKVLHPAESSRYCPIVQFTNLSEGIDVSRRFTLKLGLLCNNEDQTFCVRYYARDQRHHNLQRQKVWIL